MSVTDQEVQTKLEGDHAVDTFVDRLENRVGTDLRCVAEYDESGWDVRFHRADLQRDEFDIVLTEMKQQVRAAARAEGAASDAAPHTLVSCYGDVSVIHVRRTARRSIAVLVNADATPRIRAFARELRDRRPE